ncbi:hypothetical protein M8J75_005289 [Diaphorina citri]|nr:hypothetical protein M8J75_005289 [Diaphorina citri]
MGIQDNIDGEELARRILEESKAEPLDTTQCKAFPPWFDEKKFKRGQAYFHDNYFAMFVAKLSGLVVILAVPSILKVLIMTGKSAEPVTAFKRYLDTILHMLQWYNGNMADTKSRYNLCHLSDNLTESKKCCDIIRDKMFKPLMENPHEDFPSMCMALLLGIKAFVPSNDPEGFLLFTKFLCGIDVNIAKLAVYGRMMYRFQDFIHTHILNSPFWRVVFKPILNFNMWFAVFVCERFTSTISALHFGRR